MFLETSLIAETISAFSFGVAVVVCSEKYDSEPFSKSLKFLSRASSAKPAPSKLGDLLKGS